MLGHPNFLKWFCKCWSFVRQINCPLPRLLIGSLLQRLQLRSWAMVGIVNHYFYYSCIQHSVFSVRHYNCTMNTNIASYYSQLLPALSPRIVCTQSSPFDISRFSSSPFLVFLCIVIALLASRNAHPVNCAWIRLCSSWRKTQASFLAQLIYCVLIWSSDCFSTTN